MEELLYRLFDYYRFNGHPGLKKMIEQTETSWSLPLEDSLDDEALSMAAGGIGMLPPTTKTEILE